MDDSEEEDVAETKPPAPKSKTPTKPYFAQPAIMLPVVMADLVIDAL